MSSEHLLHCKAPPDETHAVRLGKQRIMQATTRELRTFTKLPVWGQRGVLAWFVRSTWGIIAFYAFASYLSFAYPAHLEATRARLGITGTPYLITPLQLASSFLLGLTMNTAVQRFKAALSALLMLEHAVENLRIYLCASTRDPKISVAVQCFIVWMMALIRKDIAYFREDFSVPMRRVVDPLDVRADAARAREDVAGCALFRPEVLWSSSSHQFHFVFQRFLQEALLIDKYGRVKGLREKMTASWRNIEDLLQVRAPTTSIILTKFIAHVWLVSVPLFADSLSRLALPLVAALFHAVLILATELADPWGNDFHDLPLEAVMTSLATPLWSEAERARVPDAVDWLNRGLTAGDWTHAGPEHAIPRSKVTGAFVGEAMDFSAMCTLFQVQGFSSWERYLCAQRQDMEDAAWRGQRLPQYLQALDVRD